MAQTLNDDLSSTEVAQSEATDAPPSKKKKKNKYSNKNLKRTAKLDRNLSKASRRLAKAISRGIENWEENRDKAASKRKDGAFVKVVENSAQAVGTFLREVSYVPEDLTRGQKLVRKMVPFARR
jgi:hypothetical protein